MQNKIIYYMDQIADLQKGIFVPPITCEIDLSNKCPLNCNFCMFAGSNHECQEDLSWDIYTKLLRQLRVMKVRSITFTGGGEPLMNPHAPEMISMALDSGFQVGLITNGLFLHTVKRKQDLKFIRVSINAGTAHDYEKVTNTGVFENVVRRTKDAIDEGAFVGWSFVVCPDNVGSIQDAKTIAKNIGAKYIQFKPAWINGAPFNDYEVEDGEKNIIDTRRYIAMDNLPCLIAHLIGIVGADGCLYYCCQYRGDNRFKLGDLAVNSFRDLWYERLLMWPDVKQCPHCRYMNYAKAYEDLRLLNDIFFDHKDFL
jgi:MoaA/NifB/PqqE/SkfB family radical SAM enzyme